MKWVLFTGTWKLANKKVESDVRQAVREVLERGDGVLTGGTTGVDYYAMDETIKLNPSATHLRIIIPASLESYIDDCDRNWCLAPITKSDVKSLSDLLYKIKEVNPTSILEMPHTIITQEHYNLRNEQEVMYANEVMAFQVNDSTGTQHTIDKATEAGIPVALHKKYSIQ
ncbi:MAG: hypothetical protein US50_C0015G0002 [Candidatus Nomurabacteria bacterium GW2011_GWB1_37_5]|uniref:Uncharacterized protein n=1 Tax=Candidatus Nomurabacteria bacterium GW2011_GWB1_37_5 TaxID=1618742 RepID=A0A0G0HA42_9BACT|nr:MAG: hypothetical protein US50_C0015G0002 [Candidatus Nomurabacteria bacterium GW2011_GWB1_37_5]